MVEAFLFSQLGENQEPLLVANNRMEKKKIYIAPRNKKSLAGIQIDYHLLSLLAEFKNFKRKRK